MLVDDLNPACLGTLTRLEFPNDFFRCARPTAAPALRPFESWDTRFVELILRPVSVRFAAVVPPDVPLAVEGGVELVDVTNGSGEAVALEMMPFPPHPSLEGLG